MHIDHAWRDYLSASHRFAAASDRLSDRLPAFVGEPASAPRMLSPRDAAVWLELTAEVEQAAMAQRRALEDYLDARKKALL